MARHAGVSVGSVHALWQANDLKPHLGRTFKVSAIRTEILGSGDTWSAGITAEELEQFAWVEPQVEVSVRFTEWTKAGVLRHAALAADPSR